MHKFLIVALSTCLLLRGFVQEVTAGYLGPSPYLAFDNSLPGAGSSISPFSGLSFDYFYLQNFENLSGGVFARSNDVINTGSLSGSVSNQLSVGAFLRSISGSGGGNSSVISSPGSTLVDSVDADDGTIDGNGSTGRSLFNSAGGTGIKISFNATVLGSLPTHAGLVWTDGAANSNVIFEAFDANDVSLGIFSNGGFPDAVVNGTTAEDRFLGVTHSQGISAIFIRQNGGGIEVDHLQYGSLSPVQAVPEPAAISIWVTLALLAVGFRRFRRLISSTSDGDHAMTGRAAWAP